MREKIKKIIIILFVIFFTTAICPGCDWDEVNIFTEIIGSQLKNKSEQKSEVIWVLRDSEGNEVAAGGSQPVEPPGDEPLLIPISGLEKDPSNNANIDNDDDGDLYGPTDEEKKSLITYMEIFKTTVVFIGQHPSVKPSQIIQSASEPPQNQIPVVDMPQETPDMPAQDDEILFSLIPEMLPDFVEGANFLQERNWGIPMLQEYKEEYDLKPGYKKLADHLGLDTSQSPPRQQKYQKH